jgi:hypothetical protein
VELTHTNSFFGSPAQAKWDSEASHLYWVREDVVSVGQFVSVYVSYLSRGLFPPACTIKIIKIPTLYISALLHQ